MGFLDKILGLFTGANDPAAAKKKRLQQLAKELNQSKYSKFYRFKTGELEPAFAKFFFDIYKVISPTQVFLQNALKSAQLKQIVVDAFLDKELLELQDRLSAVAISERAGTMPVKELSGMIKRELSNYIAAFDSARVNSMDNCYNAIIALVNFVSFDYFYLLKKFDPALTERGFNYQPKFLSVKGTELTEPIKDFLEFSASVEIERDWKAALGVLKTYKEGMDVVNIDHWLKLIRVLKDVSRTRILELIVRHISSDPLWLSVPKLPDERMTDMVLDAKKAGIEGAINKIEHDKRSAQIEQLAKTIFGSATVDRMINYIDKNNEQFYKKNFEGYTRIAALNYLKAYLLDYFKKEIRELCDLLLVRGQWSNIALSQSMSNAYHEVMGLSEQLTVFDDSLSDKGEHGSRLRQALLKVDRDKGQNKYIKSILNGVNNTAQRLINTASTNLVTIGRNFKNLLEDMQKRPAELIMNWRELETAADFGMPLAKCITEDYKRMYFFVQLLQFFTAPVAQEEPPINTGKTA
jgi:DNA-binding transcriptional ArsR family regulator